MVSLEHEFRVAALVREHHSDTFFWFLTLACARVNYEVSVATTAEGHFSFASWPFASTERRSSSSLRGCGPRKRRLPRLPTLSRYA